jgi:hypothetical protein
LCLPTAPRCQLKETEISVRRRFLGSARISYAFPKRNGDPGRKAQGRFGEFSAEHPRLCACCGLDRRADRWTEAMWRNLEQQVGAPEPLKNEK